MANFLNDYSQIVYPLANTIVPQQLTAATTPGTGVLVFPVGANRVNAMLQTGAVSGFTSLVVKMQSSPDNLTWTDITDQGTVQAFTTVTAANTTPQIISFQTPVSSTSPIPLYVRAFATLVGTSIYCAVALLGSSKYGGFGAGNLAAPQPLT